MNDDSRREATAPTPTGRFSRFTTLREGAVVADRYLLREPIGSGGFAEVFRAHDRVADLECALKVLFPRGDDRLSLERLRREVRAIRTVVHPGVVRVYDVGECGGLLFLAMELLRGESLRRRLDREGALPVAEALRIETCLLQALGAAHAAGIVHRDITPANVFLEKSGRVVILDFGLARSPTDTTLTATGQMIGTAAYMSPEQARGQSTGTASDVYSSGVVLWEMLAGKPPFPGQSQAETLAAHMKSPLPALPRKARRAPRRARRVLRWMLEKKPGQRPDDARVAHQALEGRAGSAALRFRLRQVGRGARSHWLLASTVATLLAILGLVPVSVESDRDNRRRLHRLNALGISLGETDFPAPIKGFARWPTAGPLSRQRLVLLSKPSGRALPEEYSDQLAVVDILTGHVSPYSFGSASPLRLRYAYPRYDLKWKARRLTPIELGEENAVLVEYSHRNHYPYVAQIAGTDGLLAHNVFHTGSFSATRVVNEGDGQPLIVIDAVNNLLGNRRVLILLDPSQRQSEGDALPPIQREDIGSGNWIRGYTMLGASALAVQESTIDAPSGLITYRLGDGSLVAYRLRDGSPDSAALREGLSVDEWLSAQGIVFHAFEESNKAVSRARPDAALDRITEGLDQPRLTATHRAVLLGRGAHFALQTNQPELALALARQANELEPDVLGHVRVIVMALATTERFEEIARVRETTETVTDRHIELNQDFFFADLLADPSRPPADIGVLDDEGDMNWSRMWFGGVLRLHNGEFGDVLDHLAEAPEWRDTPEWQFLDAMARLLGSQQYDPDNYSDPISERALGSGQMLPLAALQLLEARLLGEEPPPPDQIHEQLQRGLATQRDGARWNIGDLYFLAWGEALAARLEANMGDGATLTSEGGETGGNDALRAWFLRVLADSPL